MLSPYWDTHIWDIVLYHIMFQDMWSPQLNPALSVISLWAFSSFPPQTPQSHTLMLRLPVPPPLTDFPDLSLSSLPAHLPQHSACSKSLLDPETSHGFLPSLSHSAGHATFSKKEDDGSTFLCLIKTAQACAHAESPCCPAVYTHPSSGRMLAVSATSGQPFPLHMHTHS